MKKTKYYNPNPYNATHASFAFLLFWAAMGLSTFALYAILAAVRDSGKVISDVVPYLCLESVVTAIALALVVAIVSGVARANPASGGGFLSRKGLGMEKFMAAVGVCGMSVLLAPLANETAWNFEVVRSLFRLPSTEIDSSLVGTSGLTVLYAFVLVPLLPAIFEELLFRGVIMRGYLQVGKAPAVILSAAAFALAHGNTDQIVYQFLFGLAVGFVVLETRSLGVGMVAHFANNFFAQALAVVEAVPETWKAAEVYAAIVRIMSVFIALCCFTAAVLYFGRRLLHSQKHPERAESQTKAVFVSSDPVSGTMEEDVRWTETGKLLSAEDEEKYFTLDGRNRIRHNRQGKFSTAAILLAIGLLVSVTRIFLNFFSII